MKRSPIRYTFCDASFHYPVQYEHSLSSIFNGNRQGSICTDRIKMRHQDVRSKVQHQKGIKNQTDFMLRNAKPLSQLSKEEQNEADDIDNILYMLHTAPIIDHIGLSAIAEHTTSDPILEDPREGILAQNFTSSNKSYQE